MVRSKPSLDSVRNLIPPPPLRGAKLLPCYLFNKYLRRSAQVVLKIFDQVALVMITEIVDKIKPIYRRSCTMLYAADHLFETEKP